MLCSTLLAAATLLVTVIAAPAPVLEQREIDSNDVLSLLKHTNLSSAATLEPLSEVEILSDALTLEHIQAAFYRQGLQNYSKYDFSNSGFSDAFYATLQEASDQAAKHVVSLSSALEDLGAPVPSECLYDWSTLEGTTAWTREANKISGLLTSTWLFLFYQSQTLLSTFGSIFSEDVGHLTAVRDALDLPAFSLSTLTALDSFLALNIAKQFVISCPEEESPSFTQGRPTPALKIRAKGPGPITVGSTITLSADLEGDVGLAAAFVGKGKPIWFDIAGSAAEGWTGKVPEGVAGQSFVYLNMGKDTVTPQTVVAGPTIVEVGES